MFLLLRELFSILRIIFLVPLYESQIYSSSCKKQENLLDVVSSKLVIVFKLAQAFLVGSLDLLKSLLTLGSVDITIDTA